jgi:putative N6-adenine-specific DNA methylase
MRTATADVFAACAPGLEPVLAAELRALGLEAHPQPGGALARGEDAAALVCLGSRVADAALLRLWEGPAGDLPAAKRAARACAGGRELLVRADGGRATISVDAAGAPLFRRGWRARVGAAPLRESIAAGLLLAAGFDGDVPFLDPMCGSGTLAIEAALVAARRAPGLGRSFAFEALPGHDAARTARVRARLAALARPVPVPIHASDRNAGALRLAAKNAAAAGIADAIAFARADAAAAPAPAGPGLLAVNPPYGVRLDAELQASWRALGALLARLPGWRAAVLAPARGGEALLGLLPGRAAEAPRRISNGGLACLLALRSA